MSKGLKIALYILGGLIIAYLIYASGVYSGKKIAPTSLTVPPGKTSAIVNGWWIFLRGNITEITTDYLTILSEDKSETVKVGVTSATLCRSQLPDEEVEARMKADLNLAGYALIFEPIELSDLKVGDLLQITTMEHEGDYLALQISRAIKPEK